MLHQQKKNPIKIVQIISACAVVTILAMSSASAQQTMKGVVAGIDEPAGKISIQQFTSGTIGAGSAATESYRVNDGLLFNAVHLGDKVAISVETIDGC